MDNDAVTRGLDELDPGEWLLSMSSWVIQDGNYADFAVGEPRRFALEYFHRTLREVEPGIRSAEALGGARYEITAEVAYAARDWATLDFGLFLGLLGFAWSGCHDLIIAKRICTA